MPHPLIEELLAILPDAPVETVLVGLSWTAVVVGLDGQRRCGLATTQRSAGGHGAPVVSNAGGLASYGGRALAGLARSASLTERSIGLAAINALLPRQESAWTQANASEVIAARGAGKRVALVGHFPFVDWLRQQVGALWVLELAPREGDLPAEAAADIIPQADVVAITGTTLINGTFDELMALRQPDAFTLILGPTTPLSPLFFQHGVDLIAGAVVEEVDAVLRAVSQGAGFRQVHRAGVRLVTMQRQPDLPD